MYWPGVFKRLLPLAHGQQIRLVLPNRRDYPGSKPYTQEDVDLIQSADSKQHSQFFSDRAIDLAEFIVAFAEKECLPKVDASGTSGGVAIMAWSSGNVYAQPLLSLPEGIPLSTKSKLEEYLRLYVIFDIPLWVLGDKSTPGLTKELRDTSIPFQVRVKRFNHWVSAYYDHPSTSSRRREDLQFWPDSDARSTVTSNMTESEFADLTDYNALPRSEVSAQTVRPENFEEWTRKAFFDNAMAQDFFPKIRVVVIWAERSHSLCVESAWRYQRFLEECGEPPVSGRQKFKASLG